MIDLDYLRSRLTYDPDEGVLYWRAHEALPPKWNGRFAGKAAFTAVSGGYRVGTIDGVKYYAHRVAFAMVHGFWPEQIDHQNQDKSDNRICNLAAVSAAGNCKNLPRSSRNTSGVTGVTWDASRDLWSARITANRRCKFLGRFDTLEAAAAARASAEKKFGFSQNHGRKKEHR